MPKRRAARASRSPSYGERLRRRLRTLGLGGLAGMVGSLFAWWVLGAPMLWLQGSGAIQEVSLRRSEQTSVQELGLRVPLPVLDTQPTKPQARPGRSDDSGGDVSPPPQVESSGPRDELASGAPSVEAELPSPPPPRPRAEARGDPAPVAPPPKPRGSRRRVELPESKPDPHGRAGGERATVGADLPVVPTPRPWDRRPIAVKSGERDAGVAGAASDPSVVQVAASRRSGLAAALARELQEDGFSAYVLDRPEDRSGLRFKVRVRPRDGEGVEKLMKRLRQSGREGRVVRR